MEPLPTATGDAPGVVATDHEDGGVHSDQRVHQLAKAQNPPRADARHWPGVPAAVFSNWSSRCRASVTMGSSELLSFIFTKVW
jgi:hypothetical protein